MGTASGGRLLSRWLQESAGKGDQGKRKEGHGSGLDRVRDVTTADQVSHITPSLPVSKKIRELSKKGPGCASVPPTSIACLNGKFGVRKMQERKKGFFSPKKTLGDCVGERQIKKGRRNQNTDHQTATALLNSNDTTIPPEKSKRDGSTMSGMRPQSALGGIRNPQKGRVHQRQKIACGHGEKERELEST